MKAQSHHIEPEHFDDPSHFASPYAAVLVALGGAFVVVGAMLLVGFPELGAARLIPDFAALQSFIVG